MRASRFLTVRENIRDLGGRLHRNSIFDFLGGIRLHACTILFFLPLFWLDEKRGFLGISGAPIP